MRAADRVYIRVPGRADGALGSLALGHTSAVATAKPEGE